ncbi:MAG: hypothetical protein ACKVU2_12600 [Saprospiraceae bacterium]
MTKQINYFGSTGQIAGKHITNLLYEQLEMLREHQYEMAKEGRKWIYTKRRRPLELCDGSFDLYYNSMAPVGITLMAESSALSGVFVVFDDPNFMFVGDTHFFNYTKNWMLNLQKKCIKISQGAEGQRRIYFEHIKNRVAGSSQA